MQKKSQDFSIEEAMKLAKSPAGQQLLAMLQNANSQKLQKAMDQASTGNYTQASHTLQDLLSTPEAKKLLDELGR